MADNPEVGLEGDELFEATIKELEKIDHQLIYESMKPLIKMIRKLITACYPVKNFTSERGTSAKENIKTELIYKMCRINSVFMFDIS